MRSIIYLLIPTMLFIVSCTSTSDTVTYTVASHQADCTGVGPQKCLLVKRGNATEWEYFYANIEGFNYEPDYEYELEVKEEKRENTPADMSSIRYILIKENSKVNKDSENLPQEVRSQNSDYQFTGKVLAVESENIGRGAAEGEFTVDIVKVEVTSLSAGDINEGDVIYCELVPFPRLNPEIGNEYVFRAKQMHPAHAKGKYMLDTDLMDLV